MELLETILAPGVLNRGAIREKEDIIKKAYNAGQKAIETLKKGKKIE